MKHILLWPAALFFACSSSNGSSSSGATFNGTIDGGTFDAQSAFVPLSTDAVDGVGLTVVIADQPAACAALQSGTRDPSGGELQFYLTTTTSPDAGVIGDIGLGSANMPGIYPVMTGEGPATLPDGGYPGPGVRAANVFFIKPLSSCNADFGTTYGVSGTVTLTQAGGNATWYSDGSYDAGPSPAATFDVVLNTGDHITGQFNAAVCGYPAAADAGNDTLCF